MNNLLARTLTALVLGTVAVVAVWVGGVAFAFLMATLCGVAAFEWAGISASTASSTVRRTVMWTSVAGALASVLIAAVGAFWLTPLSLVTVFVIVYAAAVRLRVPGPWIVGAGPVYIGIAGTSLIWLREADGIGVFNVLLVLVCVWATDIGAYFAGRSIGGPRLAPKISPNKTWSGLLGGIVAAASGGFVLSTAFGGASTVWIMLMGGTIALVSQGGDLLESSLKRHFGIKDSGHILPGHGGVLDRVDGVLAAAPFVAATVAILGQGVFWL